MKNWISEYSGVLLILAGFTMLLVALAFLNRAECHSRWDDSGLKARWALVSGCMVQREDGLWIPAENSRHDPFTERRPAKEDP